MNLGNSCKHSHHLIHPELAENIFANAHTKGSAWFLFSFFLFFSWRCPGTMWLNYRVPAGSLDRCYWSRYQTDQAVKHKQPAYQAVWQLNARHQIQWAQSPVQLVLNSPHRAQMLLAVASLFRNVDSLAIDLRISSVCLDQNSAHSCQFLSINTSIYL